jgi:outer membrane receptor protein involved in Fe transport
MFPVYLQTCSAYLRYRDGIFMRLVTITLWILTSLRFAVAQEPNEYLISGSVTDEAGEPILFANVALLTAADSSIAGGNTTDEQGRFSIKTKQGDYIVKITFLSFEEKLVPVTVTTADVNIDKIVLKSSTRVLEEVEVIGEKSQMDLQLDKRVFNVGKDLSNIGGSAADILNNVPSVNVEVDGTVSLRGSENVRILINGKPSGLTSRDPNALRLLQGNLVERVEVITNPSSRYEAAGEVGIINIVLKKDQDKGINGTFVGTAGHPDFAGTSYSLNIRRKKLNIFSGYGFDYRSSPGYSRSFQILSADSTYRQNTDQRSSERSHTLRGGVDYFINDKNSVTASIMYNTSDGLSKSNLTFNDYLNDELYNSILRTDREREDERNVEGAINYRKEFEKKDQLLTIDLQYIESLDAESSDFTQTSSEGSTLQQSINDALEKNWLFQTDYVQPFPKSGKAEVGFRSATRIVDNEFQLEEQNEEGQWIAFPAFNNNLLYTERIHAAYVMAGNEFNNFSLQAGLRAEYSDITTELKESSEVNPREYLNFFPSVNMGYELKRNRTLQLSYSRRINRPEFRDLLPFSNFTNNRVFFVGNPNLNPEYTHSFEAGYLVELEKVSILLSAYYRLRQGVIQRITEAPDSAGVSRVIPVNLATQDAYGLEFNLSLDVAQWWQINSSANFFRAITEGQYNEELLYSDTYSFNTRTTSKITLWKKLEFQAAFNYRGPRITTQGKDLSSYSIDLSIAKDVLKGRGTLTANVRDLLNTRLRRSIVEIDDYYSESVSQNRPRQIRLSFTYRLNTSKERERRNDQGGGDEIED